MGKINAKIYSLLDGYEHMQNLKAIKIVSKNYNLLIMEDYIPVIGEIDGDIIFISDDSEKTIDKMTGYYKCSHNNFELLIKTDD